MKKILQPEKSLMQTFWVLKTCLFCSLLLTGIFSVKAQQKFPPPLNAESREHKPGIDSHVPPVNNPLASQLTPTTGTWTPVAPLAPHKNSGGMLLLSDGTVLAKSEGGE